MTGAQALLKALENHGVTEMFAYPGGAVLPIYDAMADSPIRRILVRHEQASAFAAQGYSRSTQEVGVCLATSGPGATNLVTGIADAMLDSIPLVAITGNVFKQLIGSDAFQEIDIVGICEPIVKHSYFIESADDIPRVLAEAFHLAKSGRPGPVLIDIPKCEQIAEVSAETMKKLNNKENFELQLPGYKLPPALDVTQIEKAVELITEAKKPIVIYGHGVVLSNAEAHLKEFLEKSGIANVWTLHGMGAYDNTETLSLGMLGMHGTGAANFAVHHADLVLGIGIRFDDRITGKLSEFKLNKKFIHFDIDSSEFNKNVPAVVSLHGQIHDTLPTLTKALPEGLEKQWSDWNQQLTSKKKAWPLDESKAGKLTEITVINQLYKIMGEEDIVLVDVGQHQMWAAQRFFPKKSRKFLTSGGLGTMGFSLPTAMGAVFSGHPVWSISGDGGFQMNSQELATIAQDNLPVKIIILNNSFLGMVRQWQELFYDKNYVDTPLKNPDFVKLGEAYGIPSFRAETQEESKALLDKMQHFEGPILVEFKLEKEENVFPMVPAGESLGNTMLSKTQQIDAA
ncbi:biosynthetic-type acetolactate synthase large subunit [bacterium]|nr:biosynthetic-type acetolactate synthase large subunit [bacterium]NCQ55458.1 biosynthetic-type acetolactate synthase large subunit [Candidatus Parcubacteria bacterium]NCS67820.1 biosynthetic-type acetolactate synthase large subunit [Candidatus Peregrinibacteria bacterium]NCS96366.1 biosynthetic-type acetolactate synthase large subunit [bacterium]